MGKHPNEVNSSPKVSIIIPTKNSGRTLHKCLESIREQTYKNIEILVADANSEDNTYQIAASFDATTLVVEGERTVAKNSASKKANGEFLMFIDSDMFLQPTVVEECVHAFDFTGIGGVVIPEKTIGSGFWIRVRDFERNFYLGTIIESARFFWKQDVLDVGGFDEDIITYEESTLPQKLKRLGLKTDERITSFILHDEGEFELGKWLSKKRSYSRTARIYEERYKEFSKQQLRIIARAKIFVKDGNWKKLLKHPTLATGIIILKFLELLAHVQSSRIK
jgi:glycosyltransferase involved in cell wall biosynthesis